MNGICMWGSDRAGRLRAVRGAYIIPPSAPWGTESRPRTSLPLSSVCALHQDTPRRRLFAMSNENEKLSVQEKEKQEDAASSSSASIRHIDTVGTNVNAILANPLEGIPQEKLLANAARFARKHDMEYLIGDFEKGALVAQDPAAFESLSELSEDEKILLRREVTHKWDQPWELYYMVILCSLAAAVQGVRSAIYPTLMAGN